MDSWDYMLQGRDVYLSEDFNFQYDNHEYNNNNNNKSKLVGCELKRLDFMEMGFSDEISTDYNNVASKTNGDFMQFNNKGFSFSLVDLKSGKFGDGEVGKDGELLGDNVLRSSPRVKRSRPTKSCIESPKCQVHGCNKDLSSYKGYYKRNKVCNEHTRAARVIVSGMEQRFCQQCSRFHFLVEFDDGKRSCRKRLAVHNKRRRKAQFSSKLIESKVSEALPGTAVDSGKFEASKWVNHVKIEDSIAENMKDILGYAEGNIISMSTQQTTRALSLLSSHSDNGTSSPLLNDSPNVFKVTSQKGFHDAAMYSIETDHDHPIMISNTADLHLLGDGILRESDTGDTDLGRGSVLNLLQLSSRLQTIEQQKHSTETEAG
ncbi:hypothetical protein KSS87_013790 [Heliosperma pusillum]|nr:hypothetical protein KSS87_013790 [Heliosperma pusillum]